MTQHRIELEMTQAAIGAPPTRTRRTGRELRLPTVTNSHI